jgi:PAS domain S-box-containing protein
MAAVAYDLIQSTLLGEAAEHAPVGILVADEELRYVAVNLYACELLGYERSELLAPADGKTGPFPISPDQWAELLEQGERTGLGRAVRKDGTEIEISFFAGATKVANMPVYVAFLRPAAAKPS